MFACVLELECYAGYAETSQWRRIYDESARGCVEEMLFGAVEGRGQVLIFRANMED